MIFKNDKKGVASTNYFFSLLNLFLNALNGLFFVPLYIKKLSDINEYGVWLACLGIISSLSIIEMNISGVATQKYSQALSSNKIDRFKSLVLSNIIILIILLAICFILFIVIAHFFPKTISYSSSLNDIKKTLFLCFIGFVGMQLSLSIGAFFQSLQITLFQNAILSISVLINIGVVLFCLYYFELGLVSFAIGHSIMGLFNITSLGAYAFIIWKKFSYGKFSYENFYIKEIIKDSFGFTIVGLSSILKTNLQAPIVAIFISPGSAAILNITGKIIMISASLVSAISSSVYAGLSHIQNINRKNELKSEIGLIIEKKSLLFIGFSIFVSKGFILLWIDPELYGGILLVLIIATSQYLLIKKSFYSTLLMTSGKFNTLTAWVTIELTLNFILLILFFHIFPNGNYKIIFFPLSTAVSTLIINMIFFKIENKNHKFNLYMFVMNLVNKIIFIALPLISFNYLLVIKNKFYFIMIAFIYLVFTFCLSFMLDKKWYISFSQILRKMLSRA